MRLLDLDARFIREISGTSSQDVSVLEGAHGILFQCPRCSEGKERGEEDGRRFVIGAHYIRVCFSNPRGAVPCSDQFACGNPRWEIVSGTGYDDLTLSPSINCDIPWQDKDGVQRESWCKFHGWVKNGDAA